MFKRIPRETASSYLHKFKLHAQEMWPHIKQICYKQNDLTFNSTSQLNGDNFAIIQSLCRPRFLLCLQAPCWWLPRHFGNELIHKTKEKPAAKKKPKHTCIENVQSRKFRIGGRTMIDVCKDLRTNYFKTFPPKLFNLLCMHLKWENRSLKAQ